MGLLWIITPAVLFFLGLYLNHVRRAISGTPPEAEKLSPPIKRWTKEQVFEAYEKTKKSPTDVKQHLPPKLDRRYVVVGGSGLVGGWIVQHLLWRGEDPSAIRVLDLQVPTRPEIAENSVQFIKTDVADLSSVLKAFNAPWPEACTTLPLTVYHTVAFIKSSERKKDFLAKYLAVNVNGTKNVLEASKRAGAECFIATSSGSIGAQRPHQFAAPWSKYPRNFFQVLVNAEPKDFNAPLEGFSSCYAYSKAKAEMLVRNADSKKDGFRTGCLRPGHTISGYGVQNTSSIAWDYLRRGGAPTWLPNFVTNFVDAQNVSISHLQFESRLVNPIPGQPDLGGRAYCVTDPNPPITFGDFYFLLETLAHPSHPVRFPVISAVPLLLVAHMVETYCVLRQRYFNFLPPITGDLAQVQPALFNLSTAHYVYDDTLAREELGYKAPLESLEGMCLTMRWWNEMQEKKVAREGNGVGKERGL